MNFRILAAPVWPRGRFFALLAATALTAALLAPNVQAQAPAPAPAAPKVVVDSISPATAYRKNGVFTFEISGDNKIVR